jgi:hypothetical protein
MKPSDFDVVVDAFEKIESVRGRNDKLAILAGLTQNPATNRLTREILTYLVNPHWSYGVRMNNGQFIPGRKSGGYDEHSGKYWPSFRLVLDQLRTRKLEGKAAREGVRTFLSSVSHRYAWFMCNLLNRDLKCGLQWIMYDKLFPDLVPGHIIKPEVKDIFKPF